MNYKNVPRHLRLKWEVDERTVMKNPRIEPYLFFGGRCEEALEFYQSALGAEVAYLMRFKERPEANPPGMVPDGWGEKIMHASFRVGEATLMASDGCEKGSGFAGFSLSVTVPTVEEAEKTFAALAEGGRVTMPLEKSFFSPRFGMVTDRFGVGWMVNVDSE